MPPYIRGVSRRLLLRAFRRDGGWEQREGANHTLMRKGNRRVEVPRHGGDIAPATVGSIVLAGWSEERFWELAGRK